MINAVNQALAFVIEIIKRFITWITNAQYITAGILPLFVIGISISLIIFAIKAIRSTIWGS